MLVTLISGSISPLPTNDQASFKRVPNVPTIGVMIAFRLFNAQSGDIPFTANDSLLLQSDENSTATN
jgi:hypothetical protein